MVAAQSGPQWPAQPHAGDCNCTGFEYRKPLCFDFSYLGIVARETPPASVQYGPAPGADHGANGCY